MADRAQQKALNEPDSFHVGAQRVINLGAQNPRYVALAGFALMAAFAGIWGTLHLRDSRAQAASHALVDAFALADAPLVRAPKEPRAAADTKAKAHAGDNDHDGQDDDGDDDDSARDDGDDDDEVTLQAVDPDHGPFANPEARRKAAHIAFGRLAQNLQGPLGAVAALEAAALADAMDAGPVIGGKPADAAAGEKAKLRALSARLSDLDGDDSLAPILAIRVAELAQEQGDADAAMAVLERIIGAQNRFLGDEARLQAARLHLAAGRADAARTLLTDVQTNYPRSDLLDDVRIEMANLTAHDAQAKANTPAAG